MLYSPFPLTDRIFGDVQMIGEHGLAHLLTLAESTDFFGRKLMHRGQACLIKMPHGLLVDHTRVIVSGHRFVDRGEDLLQHLYEPSQTIVNDYDCFQVAVEDARSG